MRKIVGIAMITALAVAFYVLTVDVYGTKIVLQGLGMIAGIGIWVGIAAYLMTPAESRSTSSAGQLPAVDGMPIPEGEVLDEVD